MATTTSRLQVGQILLTLFRFAPNSIIQKAHNSNLKRVKKDAVVNMLCKIEIYDSVPGT
jgi:hypothetical protein